VGVDVALPHPDPGHHVYALLLDLDEGDVVPPQLPVPRRCGYSNDPTMRTKHSKACAQGCRSPSQAAWSGVDKLKRTITSPCSWPAGVVVEARLVLRKVDWVVLMETTSSQQRLDVEGQSALKTRVSAC
jgi:hypothetical protein